MIHIRADERNHSALCGAPPEAGSQSILGLRIQGTIYARFPVPRESDYCPKCWQIWKSAEPAFDALLHLPVET
jgi:hypothetical protein